ncbi:MAG: nuclear transport factor 2 family protein [Segniliparus sp.]|uniref:nuclear transport factor 2 family protein n=1 Tax=Segniliparus sp. TaxID=2804064 RepID=UPI003F314596
MSSPEQIRSFASQWYRALDDHAPAADLAPLLAGDDFELRVPEGGFHGLSGFAQWYERALGLFFDETHTVKSIDVDTEPGVSTQVNLVVRWEASTWSPPDAKSRRITADAYQTWTVQPSASTGKLEILSYVVDRIEYADGSATL